MKKAASLRTTKKPYVRPSLEALSLPAEEVLARGCKLATGGPPPNALGCRRGGCFKAGS
jgi:hypothetical protein